MSVDFPIDLPASPTFRSVRLRMQSAQAREISPFAFTYQVHQWPGVRWRMEAELPQMTKSEAHDWVATLAKLVAMRDNLTGDPGTFLMRDPTADTPEGEASSNEGSPQVDSATKRSNQLKIKNAPTGVTTYLAAGDYLQIDTGSSARLHIALEDVDTDSVGDATFLVAPPLRDNHSAGTSITISGASGQFILTNPEFSYDINTAIHYGITITALEDI